jgi:hypothetical protein
MSQTLELVLTHYTVTVNVADEGASEVSNLAGHLTNLTNPRDVLSVIESINGVSSTIIKNINTEEVVLSSGLLETTEE